MEREEQVIAILNGMLKRCKPIYYSNFNYRSEVDNVSEMERFDVKNPKIGLENKWHT